MPVDEINDPVGYATVWLVAGVLALVLAVGAVAVVVWATRTPRPPRLGADAVDALRAATIAQLDELAAGHSAALIGSRELHLRLSAVMRSFASHRLGIDTSSMTLWDLSRRADARPLAELIAHYYRPSFVDDTELRARPGIEPSDSLRLARDVVATW